MRGQGGSGDPAGAGYGRGRGWGRAQGRGSTSLGVIPEVEPTQDSPAQDNQGVSTAPRAPLDARGRVFIYPDPTGSMLHDSGRVSRSMREIFRKCFFMTGSAWRFLTSEATDFYWEEFKVIIYPFLALRLH